MIKVKFTDLGLIEYKQAWQHQECLFNAIVAGKTEKQKAQQHLLFCEHPHVFTLGKSGNQNNFLINSQLLEQINATYFNTNRGGDITYHGPGQIVGYPVIDLELFKIPLKDYINKLEQSIINTLAEYNIKAQRLQGATGVWVDTDNPGKTRKICAIGVKASRFVTMHGFALNVNTNLSYFNYINPCGFTDKGVTSIQNELGQQINFEQAKQMVKKNIAQVFDMELFS